jgi:hypothetical protein
MGKIMFKATPAETQEKFKKIPIFQIAKNTFPASLVCEKHCQNTSPRAEMMRQNLSLLQLPSRVAKMSDHHHHPLNTRAPNSPFTAFNRGDMFRIISYFKKSCYSK